MEYNFKTLLIEKLEDKMKLQTCASQCMMPRQTDVLTGSHGIQSSTTILLIEGCSAPKKAQVKTKSTGAYVKEPILML